jgi:hypothetical protein
MRSLYRIIHKSLRDFRPLRYSSWDGHAGREHVNRGRNTPSFCPTLQVLDMLLSAVSVLVVAQSSSEVPEGLMNYPVFVSPLRVRGVVLTVGKSVCLFMKQSVNAGVQRN